jgi:hypothetical protein
VCSSDLPDSHFITAFSAVCSDVKSSDFLT